MLLNLCLYIIVFYLPIWFQNIENRGNANNITKIHLRLTIYKLILFRTNDKNKNEVNM